MSRLIKGNRNTTRELQELLALVVILNIMLAQNALLFFLLWNHCKAIIRPAICSSTSTAFFCGWCKLCDFPSIPNTWDWRGINVGLMWHLALYYYYKCKVQSCTIQFLSQSWLNFCICNCHSRSENMINKLHFFKWEVCKQRMQK